MSKQFLTKEEVFVVKGYLSSKKDKVQPIGNLELIKAQKHAEYVIELAKAAKDKDFVGKAADSIVKLKEEVWDSLNKNSIKEYIKAPEKPKSKIQQKLKTEALDFIKYQEKSESVDKLNLFLSQFSVIDEFEEVGLFFDDEIVKINKIYTMKEIIKAVESILDLI